MRHTLASAWLRDILAAAIVAGAAAFLTWAFLAGNDDVGRYGNPFYGDEEAAPPAAWLLATAAAPAAWIGGRRLAWLAPAAAAPAAAVAGFVVALQGGSSPAHDDHWSHAFLIAASALPFAALAPLDLRWRRMAAVSAWALGGLALAWSVASGDGVTQGLLLPAILVLVAVGRGLWAGSTQRPPAT